jgi:1-acyl-sn-glycerol-3-phosphate acyltransferase
MEQATTVDDCSRPTSRRRLGPVILMNLWVYPTLFLLTVSGIAVSPLLYVIWKVTTRWPTERIIRDFIWIYGRFWMLLVSPFVTFERKGFDRAYRENTPCIYVINHLSFFDTYCMAMQPVSNIAFAVRAWPFRRLFWYTAFMKLARYLDTEDDNFTQMLQEAQEITARGGSILFFPEGHRSRDGRLQRFYSGAFRMARELNLPIVPLCIVGTDILLPPGTLVMHPASVALHALPMVNPANFPGPEGHLEMRRTVKKMMAEEIAKMRRSGGSHPGQSCPRELP